MNKLAKEDMVVQGQNALDKWSGLFAEELQAVDAKILYDTQSEASLIPQIVGHIIASGGKRIRPILTILCAKLCGYDAGDRHINLAAAIEFFHTATLLHDDVVDESDLRRGVKTANNIWGNAPSVLVGDFLLGKAFQILAQDGSIKILRILSDTSAIITEGEVKQLIQISDITTSREKYLEIIASKTAALFTAACQVGAIITDENQEKEGALRDFGQSLGVAFQIVDDALDYSSKEEQLGKTIGDDFREGKVTLPVILAYAQGTEEEREFWQRTIEEGQDEKDLEKAIALINKHNIILQVTDIAEEYVNKAVQSLQIFKPCREKQALEDLLRFSVSRLY